MIRSISLTSCGALSALALCAAFAAPALADTIPLALPVSGLQINVAPGPEGNWTATEQADASGRMDVLSLPVTGSKPVTIAVAVAPAGATCAQAYDRYTKRAGLSLLERPDYVGPQWNAKSTEENDFESGLTIHVNCADVGGRALVAVVSFAGQLLATSGEKDRGSVSNSPEEQTTAVLNSLVAALSASANTAAFASPGGALQAPTASLAARARIMADPSSATATMAAKTGSFTLPAGASVLVELTEKLSSKTAKTGQKIGARVSQDVTVEGGVVIAKGTPVEGHVTDASSSSLGGQGGSIKFEITAVKASDGQVVPLKYEAEKQGKNTRGVSVTGFFTGWGLLSKGKNYEIPAGTPLEAKTTAAVSVKVN